jgi:hypothetical protein
VTTAWDDAAWQAVSAELDRWAAQGRAATFWWRDDDAGRADPRLANLLSLIGRLGVPVALAIVPAWLSVEAADAVQGAPAGVVVLQHGFAHVNHEREIQPGERKVRPAECGGARPPAAVLAELADGAARLAARLPSRALPVLVPPWNRIAPSVIVGLPRLGYRALSTFRARPAPQPAPGLHQVNCHIDPILWREGKRFAGAAGALEMVRVHLAARREQQADPAEPTGLLTHHWDLDAPGWAFIAELIARLRAHPGVAFPALAPLLLAGTTLEPREPSQPH